MATAIVSHWPGCKVPSSCPKAPCHRERKCAKKITQIYFLNCRQHFYNSNHNSSKCCLIKLLPYILFEKCIYIFALEMASPGNQHCANCIDTLSFPILPHSLPLSARGFVWVTASSRIRRSTASIALAVRQSLAFHSWNLVCSLCLALNLSCYNIITLLLPTYGAFTNYSYLLILIRYRDLWPAHAHCNVHSAYSQYLTALLTIQGGYI